MPTPHTSALSSPPDWASPPSRTRDGLLDALEAIDVEGWEGPTATALLTFIRTDMVRPLTIDVGLRGATASQAEATAWEGVRLSLDPPVRLVF